MKLIKIFDKLTLLDADQNTEVEKISQKFSTCLIKFNSFQISSEVHSKNMLRSVRKNMPKNYFSYSKSLEFDLKSDCYNSLADNKFKKISKNVSKSSKHLANLQLENVTINFSGYSRISHLEMINLFSTLRSFTKISSLHLSLSV